MQVTPPRILVVGPSIAGATTVVGQLLRHPHRHWFLEADHVVTRADGDSIVSAQVSRLRTLFGSVGHRREDPLTSAGDHARVRDAAAAMFVADSQAARREANPMALRRLAKLLTDNGRDPAALRLVILLNKRDLPTALPLTELIADLAWPGADYVPTVASTGLGVTEAFLRAVRSSAPPHRGTA